jgi:hypothetical protein
MLRSHSLFMLLLPVLLHGQTPQTSFYPIGDPYSESLDAPVVTADYVIAPQGYRSDEQSRVQVLVLDRVTKEQVAQGYCAVEFGPVYYEGMAVTRTSAIVFFRGHDPKEHQGLMFARKYKLPSLEPEGPAIVVANYPFPDGRNMVSSEYRFKIHRSADDSKFLVTSLLSFPEKKVHEYGCWAFNADLEPLWDHMLHYDQPKGNRIEQSSVVITENGVAYIAFQPLSMKTSDAGVPTDPVPELQPFVVRLDAKGTTQRSLKLKDGHSTFGMAMHLNGDGLIAGGFECADMKKGEADAVYIWELKADLEDKAPPVSVPLNNPEKHKPKLTFMVRTANGIEFAGRSLEQLMLVRLNDQFTKTAEVTTPFGDIWYTMRFGPSNGNAVLTFYDFPKNIENLNTGKGLRNSVGYLMEPGYCVLDANGKLKCGQVVSDLDAVRDVLKLRTEAFSRGAYADRITGDKPGIIVTDWR